MAALFIVHRRAINDGKRLEHYDGVDGTLGKYGGKVLVRSDGFDVLEGTWRPGEADTDAQPERITVIEFPDKASLKRWYDSPEYTKLKELRLQASESDVIAVEAVGARA